MDRQFHSARALTAAGRRNGSDSLPVRSKQTAIAAGALILSYKEMPTGVIRWAFLRFMARGCCCYDRGTQKGDVRKLSERRLRGSVARDAGREKARQFTGAFFSVEEVERLFEAVKGDPAEFPILMAAFYGLRRSEIMGLRWRAVDFAGSAISIEHTVVQFRSDGKRKIVSRDRMKNKSSCRAMPLVPQFRELLLRMQERQKNRRELCGNCCTDTGCIYVMIRTFPASRTVPHSTFGPCSRTTGFASFASTISGAQMSRSGQRIYRCFRSSLKLAALL